jgi:hyaluronoglucosaminidase
LLGKAIAIGGVASISSNASAGESDPNNHSTDVSRLSKRAKALRQRIVREQAENVQKAKSELDRSQISNVESLSDGDTPQRYVTANNTQNEDIEASNEDSNASGSFDLRGVLIGYYGRPWSHGERMESIKWMAENGFNTLIWAPKDDPYQRANWRDPYPQSQRENFDTEIELAASLGISWVPNISPGFPLIPSTPAEGTTPSRDICFSCPEDREVLFEKYDRFFEAGTRTMMLSFDDAQDVSTHPEDAAEYGTGSQASGQAHRELLNDMYDRYAERDPSFTLLTVLRDYDGTEDSEYLQTIRSDGGLNDGIKVMWTGDQVIAKNIEPDGAKQYAENVGKDRILLWDNYPVNDYTSNDDSETRVFMGPYEGRAGNLTESVSGIAANIMSQSRCSRVALGTMAEYLEKPMEYDPEQAWEDTIRQVGGPVADALKAFAENSRSSPLDWTESPVFTTLSNQFLNSYDRGPFWTSSADDLRNELQREQTAPAQLRKELPNLAAEVEGFLIRMEDNAEAAEAGVQLLAAQRPLLRARLKREKGEFSIRGIAKPPSESDVADYLGGFASAYSDTLDSKRKYMHGTRLILIRAIINENKIDEFAQAVAQRTVEWTQNGGSAGGDVTVTVGGCEVETDDGGRFSRTIQESELPVVVKAEDGRGNGTARTVEARK